MRVHLVHAHPEPRSFAAAMRDAVHETFETRGNTVTVSDLYGPVTAKLCVLAVCVHRHSPSKRRPAVQE